VPPDSHRGRRPNSTELETSSILNGQIVLGVTVRKAFISYARVNKSHVDQLVEHLGVLGCQTWVDSSLHGGQEWWQEILGRIADCDAFLPIISRDALNSVACRREFDWADLLGKPVLPVAVEPLPKALPRRFSTRQIVDYSDLGNRDKAALTLAGGLATLPPAPPLPQPLPEPPAAPLSYLTDLVDLVSEPNALDHEQQRQILLRLEPALRSVDPQERQGGLDILDLFSGRDDIYADVDRMFTWLRATAASEADPETVVAQRAVTTPPKTDPINTTEPRAQSPGPAKTQPATKTEPGPDLAPKAETRPQSPNPPTDLGVQAASRGPAPDTDTTPPFRPEIPPRDPATPAPSAAPGEPTRPSPTQPLLQRLSRRTKIAVAGGVLVVIVAVIAAVFGLHSSQASRQIALPLTGLSDPVGVGVDTAGTVYVADTDNNRVVKLAAGSSTPTELPFTGLNKPFGVVVDTAGTVYVVDFDNNRVVMLAAGSSTSTVLTFTGLLQPTGVAVDTAGTVYVADNRNNRVVKLAAGSSTPTALPFTGRNNPVGVAVDTAGTVYVTEQHLNQVVRLAAGSSTPTALPFTGLNDPSGVAVDTAGTVYVTDSQHNRVVGLPPGS
jgi:DNA-binding beta-propeller fold protein YncE